LVAAKERRLQLEIERLEVLEKDLIHHYEKEKKKTVPLPTKIINSQIAAEHNSAVADRRIQLEITKLEKLIEDIKHHSTKVPLDDTKQKISVVDSKISAVARRRMELESQREIENEKLIKKIILK